MTKLNLFIGIGAFLLAVGLAAVEGYFVVPWLRKLKCGQHILEIGPNWHKNKEGTPVMGGIIFASVSVLLAVAVTLFDGFVGWKELVCVLFLALINGGIGLLDDCEKILKKQNLGLKAKQKLVLQFISGIAFLVLCYFLGVWRGEVLIPFTHLTITTWKFLIYPLALVMIVGTVNSVNLTDGVDGLCSGVTIPVALLYSLLAELSGCTSMVVFGAALAGALCGFLIYNFNPAKVFMGDTGSLFLGGAVVGFAFAAGKPLTLIIAGIIYYIEALSDMIQVGYFKISGGKRIFKMAPIHHHFEKCGWSERKIVAIFCAVTAAFCVLAWFGL